MIHGKELPRELLRRKSTLHPKQPESLIDGSFREKLFTKQFFNLEIVKNSRINSKHVNDSPFPRRQFVICWKKGFLFWKTDSIRPGNSNLEEGSIDLLTVNEVRHRHRLKITTVPIDSCFCIYHGDEFNLSLTVLYAPCGESVATEWVTGLQRIVKDMQSEWTLPRVDRIVLREFSLAATGGRSFNLTGSPIYDTIKNVTILLNYFKTRGMDKSKRNSLKLEQVEYNKNMFQKLFMSKWETQFEDGIDRFGKIEPFRAELRGEVMVNTYKFEQLFGLPPGSATELFNVIADDPVSNSITFETFSIFLFSEHNSIQDPAFVNTIPDEEYLSSPLSHYWINSSHNTYLTGNQYSSMSSIECYVRALRQGCRCIELDCWNGKDGAPEVLHGHTMTSTVPLVEVVQAIAEHAFSTTDLPLTLSIENHCNIEQQEFMAHYFENYFKDKLLRHPVNENEEQLPSPWELRGKIIIKNRKLKSDKDDHVKGDDEEHETFEKSFQGLVNIVTRDERQHPKFVTLFSTTGELQFSKIQSDDVENETTSKDETSSPLRPSSQARSWYHSNITRTRTEQLLQAEGRDGSWLVRDSNRFRSDYTLCILHKNTITNIRVHKDYRQGNSEPVYFLDENNSVHPICDSLETLVEHYQNNHIKPSLQLLYPVSVPEQHLRMPWFYSKISREDANRALKDEFVQDGSFLIREKGDNEFALSFRSDHDGPVSVKHGKITQVMDDGSAVFKFGDSVIFPSLVSMVEFYRRNSFYKGQTLGEPVDRALVNRVCTHEVTDNNGEDYVDHASSLRVTALHRYEGDDHNELSIAPGDIIYDVEKRQRDWWVGKKREGGPSGWFPASYVTICDYELLLEDDLLKDASDGKIALNMSFTVYQNAVTKIITLKDCQTNKSMKICKSHQDNDDMIIIDLFQSIQVYLDRLHSSQVPDAAPKMQRLSRRLSDLVVYCQATTWSEDVFKKTRNGIAQRDFGQMSSIGESKIQKYLQESTVKEFLDYNTFQISRTYPKGARIHSENYNPVNCWNAGVQMVALNFQTPDLAMQLNHAKFAERMSCGFVKKPDYLLSPGECVVQRQDGTQVKKYLPVTYNPCGDSTKQAFASKVYDALNPKTLTIKLLGGRNIFGLGKTYQSLNTSNIDFAIEIWGIEVDKQKHRFKHEGANTFNPVFDWKEVKFTVHNPDLAILRFVMSSPDPFGENIVKAVAVFAFRGIRPGIRSVPLLNVYMEPIEQAALLVDCSIND